MDEDRNSEAKAEETGSDGDNIVETPTEPGTTQEPNGKPEGEETTSGNPEGETGDTVFGEPEKPVSQFKSVEDAEKSWRETQSYASKLQSELDSVKQELSQAKNAGGNNSDVSKLEAEIKSIKVNQTIHNAFNSFRDTHSDFTGGVQLATKEIIDTYIRAGKPIKLLDAYILAKAKLGLTGDESDPSISQKKIQSASLGTAVSGGLPNKVNKMDDPATAARKAKFSDPKYFSPGLRKLLNK